MIRALVDFALNNRFVVLARRPAAARLGRDLVPQPAGRGVSRHRRQLRDRHHAVAGPRRRGGGAAGHDSDRDPDERDSASVAPAVRVDLRAVVRADDLRRQLGQRLEPRRRCSSGSRRSICRTVCRRRWAPTGALTGQIYWYTLREHQPEDRPDGPASPSRTGRSSRSSSRFPTSSTSARFGGTTREYQVHVDPNKLISYGLSIGQVEQQLADEQRQRRRQLRRDRAAADERPHASGCSRTSRTSSRRC